MFTKQTLRRANSSLSFEGVKPLTEQKHKEDVQIQNIMRKARKTGVLSHVNQYKGTYGEFADAPTYHEAQNVIAEANSMFETVPSQIRKQFKNDPSEYVSFMQNPENYEAIAEMGLDNSHLPEPVSEEPAPVEPVAPPIEPAGEE